MKGHLVERSPGHWSAVIDVPDPSSGKRKWHSLKATGKRQAQLECASLISAINGGTYLEPSNKMTMAIYLDRWLAHMVSQVSPHSHERYSQIVRKNLVPLIGSVVLTRLQPDQISTAYSKALSTGRRNGKGGLSPRTVHHMHRILKQALRQAVRWLLLYRNPADSVDPPKVERLHLDTYDMARTAALIAAMRGKRMLVPVILAVLCGLRRGEIAALRWRNVNLAASQIAVVESAEQTKAGIRYKQPTGGRARTVALSATVTEELRAHRLRQAEELLKLGIGQADDIFVVARADGQPLQPRSLTHEWVRLLATTELPRIRFHDLRHAHATHLLSSGVHPKIASERLGHSKVGITLDLYSHVLPGMQADAAALVDGALLAAQEKLATKTIG
jgi:integrase